MIDKYKQQQYGRVYKLPAVAIEALQEQNVLPAYLPFVRDIWPEDHSFLQRYSLMFRSHRLIRASLARCTSGDRVLLLKPAVDWTQYVIFEYMQAYRAMSNLGENTCMKAYVLPTKSIHAALSQRFGLQITTKVRKRVDSLRRAAYRRVVRENQKGE